MQDKVATLRRELDKVKTEITALEEMLEEEPDGGMGEGDPSFARRELNRALLKRLRERAARLERALSRIGQGTYETCTRCGGPIHPDRLAVLPDTTICIRCAQEEGGV
ncbi:MAG: TraR/DksA C4-type zinc finger protein [Anaerolineae bacterium]